MTDPAHDPAWMRLLAAARRALERTGGSLDTTVSLTTPSDAERLLVIGITGVHRAPGVGKLAIRLADVDAYLREAHGSGLGELLPGLRNRPAERAAATAARHAMLATAVSSAHHNADWFPRWLDDLHRGGILTRLHRAGRDLAPALRVLDALPAADEPMPAFAERLLGDTKALTDDPAVRGPVLRALPLLHGVDPPVSAEDERALWELSGVIPDDLASQVLVLNLPADGGLLGDWLTQAAQVGVPVRVTLHQLRLHPLTPRTSQIFVTENPAVLRAACVLGPDAPSVVCTEGVPSAAAHRLLGQASTGILWWRNDFDWAGIRMTASALARYPNARPWRMSATDYRAANGTGRPLIGTPAATPWDTQLSTDMRETGRSVMEERLLPLLLTDLRAARRG